MLQAALVSAVLCLPSPQDPVEASTVQRVVPPPTAATFGAWRRHIRPSADELRWEAIPWQASFAAGLRAASEQGRPLLLWAMNGHPLGCT